MQQAEAASKSAAAEDNKETDSGNEIDDILKMLNKR